MPAPPLPAWLVVADVPAVLAPPPPPPPRPVLLVPAPPLLP
jgi:hypothetical protein